MKYDKHWPARLMHLVSKKSNQQDLFQLPRSGTVTGPRPKAKQAIAIKFDQYLSTFTTRALPLP